LLLFQRAHTRRDSEAFEVNAATLQERHECRANTPNRKYNNCGPRDYFHQFDRKGEPFLPRHAAAPPISMVAIVLAWR
jgi:hypothetical protein